MERVNGFNIFYIYQDFDFQIYALNSPYDFQNLVQMDNISLPRRPRYHYCMKMSRFDCYNEDDDYDHDDGTHDVNDKDWVKSTDTVLHLETHKFYEEYIRPLHMVT
jgi:hypothetical protein